MARKANQKTAADRVPPHSHDAEQAVIGMCMLEGNPDDATIPKALNLINADKYFYSLAHAKIFNSVKILYECQIAVDVVTIANELEKTGELNDCGGRSYLAELAGCVATASNVEHYCHIILEKYQYRSLIKWTTGIMDGAFQESSRPKEIVDKAMSGLFQVSGDVAKSGFEPLSSQSADLIDKFDAIQQGKQVIGIPTGFRKIDAMTGGMIKKNLIVVAGRPSLGKTAFLSCVASNMAEAGHKVAVISLESSKEEWDLRTMCALGSADSMNFKTGKPTDEDWQGITKASSIISGWNYLIDDRADMDINAIVAEAVAMNKSGSLDILFIDYLQYVDSPDKRPPKRERVSAITRTLKRLAKELDIPVVIASQLSRKVEDRRDKRPWLSDLKESGDIEQDADVVIGLYRPILYASKKDKEQGRYVGVAEAIILKQRNGPVGTVDLSFIEKYARFEEVNLPDQQEVPF